MTISYLLAFPQNSNTSSHPRSQLSPLLPISLTARQNNVETIELPPRWVPLLSLSRHYSGHGVNSPIRVHCIPSSCTQPSTLPQQFSNNSQISSSPSTGLFPSSYKHYLISPILKKWPSLNQMPLSLLPLASELLIRLVYNHCVHFLSWTYSSQVFAPLTPLRLVLMGASGLLVANLMVNS